MVNYHYVAPMITIYFHCEDYLREWYIYHSGGAVPVKLKKNSPESHLLMCCLQNKKNAVDSPIVDKDKAIEVIVPYYKNRPPEYFNFLNDATEKAFVKILKRHFDFCLWSDLCKIHDIASRLDDIIYAWMESHGISITEKNWNAVAKRFQRIRSRILSKERMRKFRNKNN